VALYDLHDRPSLDQPVLVVVLEGWIDAGFAAGRAMQTLLNELDTYPVASFDADALLDHRARRPVMHLVEGVNTGLSWPGIELRAGTDDDGNDLLLLVGAEPDHAWRQFVEAVLELAELFGVRMLVGLGAYPATVPHTRPVTMSVTAATEELAAVSGLLRGTLDVPAGVQAALEYRFGEAGIAAVGLWSQVPHYVSGDLTPYPAAALALVERLSRTAGLSLPTGSLVDDAARTRNRIDAAMAANTEHLAMLRTLEQSHDAQVQAGPDIPESIPSADELAAEVERYLRDQGVADDDPADDDPADDDLADDDPGPDAP
jgi:proteasome assembly chaperone (PAC2) family protein